MTPPQETFFFHPLYGTGHLSHPSLTTRDRELVSVQKVRIEHGDIYNNNNNYCTNNKYTIIITIIIFDLQIKYFITHNNEIIIPGAPSG